MSEHDADYKKVTQEAPIEKQIEALSTEWVDSIRSAVERGFAVQTIASAMVRAALGVFADDANRVAFLTDLLAAYRGRVEQQPEGPPN